MTATRYLLSGLRPGRDPLTVPLRRALVAVVGLALVVALGVWLARAPLSLAALAVGGAALVLLVLRWPTLGLYPLALAIPFGSLREVRVGPATVGASELLVWIMLGAWLLRLMTFRSVVPALRRAWSPLAWALLAHLGTMTLSLLPTQALEPAAKELTKWVELLALYLLVRAEVRPRQRLGVAVALLLGGLLQGALGIYQFFYQVGPPGFLLMGRFMRAHGTFLQPNPFAAYLGLLLPLAYALLLVGLPGVRDNVMRAHCLRRLWPLLGWAATVLVAGVLLAALAMSWSRGALVGLALGGGLVGLALARRHLLAIGLALLVLAVVLPIILPALPSGITARFSDVTGYVGEDITQVEVTDENFGVVERVAHWQAAWRMFARRPWLGVGTGQYAVVYPEVASPRWADPLGHAHNAYLHVLAEGGLLGLATYLLVAVAAMWNCWRAAARARGLGLAFALGALGMLGHLYGHGAFDQLFVHEMYLLVAVLLGMAESVCPEAVRPVTVEERNA